MLEVYLIGFLVAAGTPFKEGYYAELFSPLISNCISDEKYKCLGESKNTKGPIG